MFNFYFIVLLLLNSDTAGCLLTVQSRSHP